MNDLSAVLQNRIHPIRHKLSPKSLSDLSEMKHILHFSLVYMNINVSYLPKKIF